MSLSNFDRESIRVDIDRAMNGGEEALAFLLKYGADIRDMAVDPRSSEYEEERDTAYADADAAEKRAAGYEAALEKLVDAVDSVCDDLEAGRIYDRLFAASLQAAEMVKDL